MNINAPSREKYVFSVPPPWRMNYSICIHLNTTFTIKFTYAASHSKQANNNVGTQSNDLAQPTPFRIYRNPNNLNDISLSA